MENWRWPLATAAVVAALFGLLRIYAGGRTLFGGPEVRAAVVNRAGFAGNLQPD